MDADYYLDISDKIEDNRTARQRRVLLSTLIYCITFFSAEYIEVYIRGFFSYVVGFKLRVLYYGIDYIDLNPYDWDKIKILLIFLPGPIVCLVVGLICYWINAKLRDLKTIWKVIALWMSVHCVTLFLSNVVTSAFGVGLYSQNPFYYGYAVVASWFHIPQPFMVPVALIGLLLLIGAGMILIRPFLSLAFSRPVAINFKTRRIFINQVFIYPWLIGMAITTVISLPPPPYEMRELLVPLSKNVGLFFIFLGMLFKLDHIVDSLEVRTHDVFKRAILPIAIVFILFILSIKWYDWL